MAKRAIKTTTSESESTAKKKVVKVKKIDKLVDAYIPDESIAKRYVGRQVHGVWDFDIAKNAMANKRNILLMGDTGSGKTMFGEAFAAKEQLLYYSLPCDVSIDPSALFGKMQATDVAGQFRWQDGPVTQLARAGGVLNISEVNMMTPKIAASMYPLLDSRRYIPLLGHEGEVVRAHPRLLIIADMNPNYRGTMELNAAFKNRFPLKIMWGYDDRVEKKLIGMPSLIDLARRIRAQVGVDIITPVSTNMLMEFEKFATDKDFGLDFAIGNFVNAFQSDEQKPVNDVLVLVRGHLQRDLAILLGEASADEDADVEEIEVEYEVEWEQ